MMTPKEMADAKEQLKKDITDLDHQIYQLESFYIEDTKEAGNLLKGFENYVSLKTSKIQAVSRKLKVDNCQRLFSLSSSTCKTSTVLEDTLSREQVMKPQVTPTNKRRRPAGGMTKSGGKHLMPEGPPIEQESDSDDNQGGDDSNDDSILQSARGKSKKIAKKGQRK